MRIRNFFEVTGRRCYNVSGTSWKLLAEDVITYQKQLRIDWKKMLQRIRKILEVNASGFFTTYQEHLGSYCKKMLQSVRNILEVNILTSTGRSCYNVSERCWKSLKKMFPRIGKILEFNGRRCYNVPGTSWHFLAQVVSTHQKDVGS